MCICCLCKIIWGQVFNTCSGQVDPSYKPRCTHFQRWIILWRVHVKHRQKPGPIPKWTPIEWPLLVCPQKSHTAWHSYNPICTSNHMSCRIPCNYLCKALFRQPEINQQCLLWVWKTLCQPLPLRAGHLLPSTLHLTLQQTSCSTRDCTCDCAGPCLHRYRQSWFRLMAGNSLPSVYKCCFYSVCRLYLTVYHAGLFLTLFLGQIGVQGRRQGYWN